VVSPFGLYYAPDPSSQIACTIGGNVAENSGGVHCLKYGLTVHNVRRVRGVLITGEVVEFGGDALDSAGYDLLALVHGSEGLLAVTTEITVKLTPKPQTAQVALAAFADVGAAGAAVAAVIGAGIVPAGLEMMDRYNFLPMLNNYLFAADAAQANRGISTTPMSLPCEGEGEWYFPDAGLLVHSTSSYFAVSGLAKGGVLKVYDRRTRKLAISDCGYWVSLGGRTASSQGLNRQGSWTVLDGRIEVCAVLVETNQRIMSPWLFVAFRLFSLTLGRLQRIAYWVKNLLVRVLVQRRRTVGMQLIRRIVLERDRVSVVDTLTNPLHLRVEAVFLGQKFSTIHMGSSRYFQLQELDPTPLSSVNGALEALSRGEALQRSQHWSFE
jgi:hypothetical protein